MTKIQIQHDWTAKQLAVMFSGIKIPAEDMERMIQEYALSYAKKYCKEKNAFKDEEDGPGVGGYDGGDFYKD